MSGGNAGPTPFGPLLCGLAACTAMTLRMFAGAATPITTSIRAVETPTPRPTS